MTFISAAENFQVRILTLGFFHFLITVPKTLSVLIYGVTLTKVVEKDVDESSGDRWLSGNLLVHAVAG